MHKIDEIRNQKFQLSENNEQLKISVNQEIEQHEISINKMQKNVQELALLTDEMMENQDTFTVKIDKIQQ
jgi:hypothetical protein